jgi:thioester reductase-like protein
MKTVFITGASGAIGSALVPLFLREQDTEVRLLLRADTEDHLRQRLDNLLRFWQVGPNDARTIGRIAPVRGDVCAPQLGLDGPTYRKLTAEVTHVIHAAGNVKLNQTLAEARRNALEAARQIVTFVHSCRTHGQFQKADFVSTVGVAGRTRGLVREEPMRGGMGYHNTYEEAKAEAEAFILEEIGKGLPATIHRPSMVVGDSRTGAIIHFQVFYHLSEFLTGCRTWGIVPDTGDIKLDIIPADYVARILHESSARPETIGRLFHLCSGPERALSLVEMTDRLRDLFGRRGRRLPRLRRLHPRWFRAGLAVLARCVPAKKRRAFQGLHFFLAYLDEEQVFDNRRTREFFAPHGIDIPRVEEYLPTILDYYWTAKYAQRHPDSAADAAAESDPPKEGHRCSLPANETT